VPALPSKILLEENTQCETSEAVRTRVIATRALQYSRQQHVNGELTTSEINKRCQLQEKDRTLLLNAMDKLQISARSFHRILKVARTIADIEQRPHIASSHLREALSYRRLDRLSP